MQAMRKITGYKLKKGDIGSNTECQARDGILHPKDWVIKCPKCGHYTHIDCWVKNQNHCPYLRCLGKGEVYIPSSQESQQLPAPLHDVDSDNKGRIVVTGKDLHDNKDSTDEDLLNDEEDSWIDEIDEEYLTDDEEYLTDDEEEEDLADDNEGESFWIKLIILTFRILWWLLKAAAVLISITIVLIIVYLILHALFGLSI